MLKQRLELSEKLLLTVLQQRMGKDYDSLDQFAAKSDGGLGDDFFSFSQVSGENYLQSEL